MKSDSSRRAHSPSLAWLFLILASCLTSSSSCNNGNSGSTLPPVDLPTFETPDELNQSRWPEYFTDVYGNSPSSESDFPIDMNLFSLVYEDSLEAIDEGIECQTACPDQQGQAVCKATGDHDPPSSIFIYQPGPYDALPDNEWVEFTHCADPEAVSAEQVGSWMYHLPGSGNFFNLGTTQAFLDHEQAVEHFLGRPCEKPGNECVEEFTELFETARAQGFDSLQFLGHADQVCGTKKSIAVELVDLAGSGAYPCGDENPGSSQWNARYRTGWDANLSCTCVNATAPGSCFTCQ